MKYAARSILEELAENGIESGPIPEPVTRSINEKLAFIDRERKLGYAIVSSSYTVLYHTPAFNIPLDRAFLEKEREQPFLYSIASGDKPEDMLSVWHFLLRYRQGPFLVFMGDAGDYELLERVIQGLVVAFAMALALAIPSGFLLNRKVLEPLNAIEQAVTQIDAGNLNARIPELKARDEIAHLVDTLNHVETRPGVGSTFRVVFPHRTSTYTPNGS